MEGNWVPNPNIGPQRSPGLVSRVETVVGLRWLLSLLRTEQPCDAQPPAPAQVKELLAKGANTEAVDFKGKTALHYAARSGHDAVVREPPGPRRSEGHWDPSPSEGPPRSRGRASRVDAVVGLRWLLSLLRTCQPCDAQLTAHGAGARAAGEGREHGSGLQV